MEMATATTKLKKIDEVKYSFNKSPGLQIATIPIAATILQQCKRSTAHRTNFYKIIWFMDGTPVHCVDMENITIQSPAILFIHKDKVHKFDEINLHDGKALIFTDEFYCRTKADKDFLTNCEIFNSVSGAFLVTQIPDLIRVTFIDIAEEIKKGPGVFSSQILYSLLNVLMYAAERLTVTDERASVESNHSAYIITAFLSLLEESYFTNKLVKDYAAALNLTASKLNSSLMLSKGKTAKQLITQRVLSEAKRLLLFSDANVKEISFKLGFNEPTNFNKFFFKNIKRTPSNFKQHLKKVS